MDGGALTIEWREEDDHVLMTGPVAVEFTGRLPEPDAEVSPGAVLEPAGGPGSEYGD
jgi:hypothetical protein